MTGERFYFRLHDRKLHALVWSLGRRRLVAYHRKWYSYTNPRFTFLSCIRNNSQWTLWPDHGVVEANNEFTEWCYSVWYVNFPYYRNSCQLCRCLPLCRRIKSNTKLQQAVPLSFKKALGALLSHQKYVLVKQGNVWLSTLTKETRTLSDTSRLSKITALQNEAFRKFRYERKVTDKSFAFTPVFIV